MKRSWGAVLFGNDQLVFTCAMLFVLFIGFFGIRQVGIFTDPVALHIAQASYDEPEAAQTDPSPNEDVSENDKPDASGLPQTTGEKKYEKSGLTPAAAEEL